MQKIAVIDFGGQYTHLIARRIRHLGVYSEVHPPHADYASLGGPVGIIFSGGPSSVYAEDAPAFNDSLLRDARVPVLGLCYGHQLASLRKGGQVKRGTVHEFGPAVFRPDAAHPLFAGLRPSSVVWMSHGDEVVGLPPGFRAIGATADCAFAAVANDAERIYGLQFHPEVTHSEQGEAMLDNFLRLCGARRDWKIADQVARLEGQLRERCAGKKVFLLVSGGVDSTVAFALLNRALGPERVLGLHIDNGLMRAGESAEVLEFLGREGFHNLKVRDATDLFLERLRGVHAPEAKRKAIGDTFLEVKDRELERLELDPAHWLLAQGTIYPDTIESGGTQDAAVIKTHHNRVDAVRELIARGLVVEPLADFYKDEVRELGLLLGIPEALVWRHPFPGPGLGVRVLCNDSTEKSVPAGVQAKVRDFLASEGLEGEALAVESVGVQGDARSYAHPCLLRGLRDWARAEAVATRLTNRVREVNRVVVEIGRAPAAADGYRLVEGQCDRARLDFLRRADARCTEFLRSEGLYASIWQMPVVLLPMEWAGRPVVVVRPVLSSEAMTARFAPIPFEALDRLWPALEGVGVGALLYDVTHKPPGTIEWE